jgi:hypothetical protein
VLGEADDVGDIAEVARKRQTGPGLHGQRGRVEHALHDPQIRQRGIQRQAVEGRDAPVDEITAGGVELELLAGHAPVGTGDLKPPRMGRIAGDGTVDQEKVDSRVRIGRIAVAVVDHHADHSAVAAVLDRGLGAAEARFAGDDRVDVGAGEGDRRGRPRLVDHFDGQAGADGLVGLRVLRRGGDHHLARRGRGVEKGRGQAAGFLERQAAEPLGRIFRIEQGTRTPGSVPGPIECWWGAIARPVFTATVMVLV